MPELPEVETVRLGLVKSLQGQGITRVELRRANLRDQFPEAFAAILEGRQITQFRRRAKYILADLSGGYVWLIHLGMSGSFRVIEAKKAFTPETHDHVVITTKNGTRLAYNDPRRFGQMDVFKDSDETKHKSLSKLGPEPLEDAFNGKVLAAQLKGKNTPIKLALLDQTVVSGVGNIYACEALYRAGINPTKPAKLVTGLKADKLAVAIKNVMAEALQSGGSTLRDHRQLDGNTGYFQHKFDVYGRKGEVCAQCGGTIQAITQGGRTTFFCAKHQK